MMGLQIVTEEIDRATLTRCVADEDDGFGMDKIRGDLLVVGVLLGNMITLIVGLFAMDQMMLESERIIRLDGDFIFRTAVAEIVVNVGDMMVDDHNHSSYLVCFCGFLQYPGFF
jgi:hypothetical protein